MITQAIGVIIGLTILTAVVRSVAELLLGAALGVVAWIVIRSYCGS
jgi:hypothetical protein